MRSFPSISRLALSMAVAAIVALPLVTVLFSLFQETSEIWQQSRGLLLAAYLKTSLILCISVAFFSLLTGIGAAWLVSNCRLYGSTLLEVLLVMPLAIPTYVMAYIYYDLLSPSGFVLSTITQTGLVDIRQLRFVSAASVPGAVWVMVLSYYPYIYLAARASFMQQSPTLLESGRMLGLKPRENFWRISLPLARPAIMVGTALVMMETLSEYGAVSILGVQTFTVGIYKAWFSIGDITAASQLSASLLLLIAFLVIVEKYSRRGRFFQQGRTEQRNVQLKHSKNSTIALILCLLPVLFGFIIPLFYLLISAAEASSLSFSSVHPYFFNSVLVALISAGLAIIISFLMTFQARQARGLLTYRLNQIAALGYAVPGPVLAVGLLVPLTLADRFINGLMRETWGISSGQILTGSLFVLVTAYLIRFLTISLGTIEAGFLRIKPGIDEAAKVLGRSNLDILRSIHLKLLSPSLATAALLVFVDVMKELPATLILRPFNFDTLAIRVYQLAADERLSQAALPALILIAAGLLPVWILTRKFFGQK